MDERDDWYGPETATFGDRLVAARERAGLTQPDLARRLGVRVATLRSWEDDLSEPRANRLSMMAGLLNVSITWLINGQGDGPAGPENAEALAEPVRAILDELRDVRIDLLARVEQIARLERRLRNTLREDADDRAA